MFVRKPHRGLFFLSLLSLLTALSSKAISDVKLTNGDFFMSYTDFSYSQGVGIQLERIYNSASIYEGMFGWGWGFRYETKLTLLSNRELEVKEYGGGANNVYTVASPIDNNAKFEKLADIPIGTVFSSLKFGFSKLTRTEKGFARSHSSGETELFNLDGMLIEIRNRDGQWVRLSYDSGNRLTELKDGLGHDLAFQFDENERLAKILSSDGREANYEFNSSDELTFARDEDGNEYHYSYSLDGYHNLTTIGYADGQTLQVWYDERNDAKPRFVRSRDGGLTEYLYENSDEAQSKSDTVKVIDQSAAGEFRIKSTTFVYAKQGDTEDKLTRMIEIDNEGRKETSYDPGSGAIVGIEKKQVAKFEYDSHGNITAKLTDRYIERWTYTEQDKVASYQRQETLEPTHIVFSAQYKYDSQAQLSQVDTSSGTHLRIEHERGLLRRVEDGSHHIELGYDGNSRLTSISDDKLGVANVLYGRNGEIQIKPTDPSLKDEAFREAISAMIDRILNATRVAEVTMDVTTRSEDEN
jgi:YD repeat-containing protein